jgi:hypothetical protein
MKGGPIYVIAAEAASPAALPCPGSSAHAPAPRILREERTHRAAREPVMVHMGDIGEETHTVELEPLEAPVEIPAPDPVPA